MALWTSLAISQELMSDPTRPPAALDIQAPLTEELANAALSLRAVFFAEGRRIAIINDRRVREQDVIGSARVLEIAHDHVRLQRNGQELRLKLVQRDIKNERPQDSGDVWETEPVRGPVRSDEILGEPSEEKTND